MYLEFKKQRLVENHFKSVQKLNIAKGRNRGSLNLLSIKNFSDTGKIGEDLQQ